MKKIAIVHHIGCDDKGIISFYNTVIRNLAHRLVGLYNHEVKIQIFVTISDHLPKDSYQLVNFDFDGSDNIVTHVKSIPNRGCDVGPFIDFVTTVNQEFDVVVKIHSKTNPEWSLRLVSIFDQIDEVIQLLESETTKIGVVGHINDIHPVLISISDKMYRKRVIEIFSEFGIQLEDRDYRSIYSKIIDPTAVDIFEYRCAMSYLWRIMKTDEEAYNHLNKICSENKQTLPPYVHQRLIANSQTNTDSYFVAGTIFAIKGSILAQYRERYGSLFSNYYKKMETGHPSDLHGERFCYTHTFERLLSGLVTSVGYRVFGFQSQSDYPVPLNTVVDSALARKWTDKYWQLERYLLQYPEVIAAGNCGLDDAFEHYMKVGYSAGDDPGKHAHQLQIKTVKSEENRPRIVIVTHEATLTGAPMTILNLACNLQAYYEINVISMKPGPILELFVWENAPIIAPCEWGGISRYLKQLKLATNILGELNPDLMIVNSTEAHVYFHAGLKLQIPMIYYSHECTKLLHQQLAVQIIPFADFGRKMLKHGLPKAPVVYYCPNRKMMSEFFGLPESSVKEIAEVVNLDRVLNNSQNFKAKDPIEFPEDGRIRIGMVAAIDHRKGYDLFQKAAENFPEILFVWIGKQVKEIPDELQLSNLIWINTTPNPHYYLKQLDYFILTSREDMCPLVVIEALYIGVKTIFFDDNVGRADLFEEIGAYRVHGNVEDDLIPTIQKLPGLQFPESDLDKIEERFGIQSNISRFRVEIDSILCGSKGRQTYSRKYYDNPQYGHINYQMDKINEFILELNSRKCDPKFYLAIYRDLSMIRSEQDAISHYKSVGYRNRIGHPDDWWQLYLILHPEYLERFIDSEDDLDQTISGWKSSKRIRFNWKQYLENYPDLKDYINTREQALYHWRNHGWKEGRHSGCN